MSEISIEKQIEEIVAEGERLLEEALTRAEKLADAHGEIVYAGEYGLGGKKYYSLGAIEALKEKDLWEYSWVSNHLQGESGWIYSSETC